MRRRLERLALIFSVALNAAFLVTAAVDHQRSVPSQPVPVAEPPRFSSHWHGHRTDAMNRRLHLEGHQRRALRQHLRTFRPELETARRDLVMARRRFREALRRDDAVQARAARQQVSRMQARLDSLTAEAMLTEIDVLHPEQRERYLRWTFERQRPRSTRHRPVRLDEP